MNPEYQRLVKSYVEWLRGQTQLADVDGVCEITTPFLDRHNDHIQIYVQAKDGGAYELHDDGHTISDLRMSGCNLTTTHRKQMLDTILKGFNVSEKDEILFVEANKQTFPHRKHALLQAILAVNDMFMTAKHHVARFFLEDVTQFLDAANIRYTPDVSFPGKSGFNHRFDFVIPRSPKQPERIIRAINNPNKDAATALLFAWTDTKENRTHNSQVYAILNDTEKQLNNDVLSAFRQYDVHTILWSEREKHVEVLAA
jgi:hypothetical protein